MSSLARFTFPAPVPLLLVEEALAVSEEEGVGGPPAERITLLLDVDGGVMLLVAGGTMTNPLVNVGATRRRRSDGASFILFWWM